jgi:hypothetical protein
MFRKDCVRDVIIRNIVDIFAVFILKIEQDENGEDVYNVPDDDVADAVFAKLVQLTEDLDQDE